MYYCNGTVTLNLMKDFIEKYLSSDAVPKTDVVSQNFSHFS